MSPLTSVCWVCLLGELGVHAEFTYFQSSTSISNVKFPCPDRIFCPHCWLPLCPLFHMIGRVWWHCHPPLLLKHTQRTHKHTLACKYAHTNQCIHNCKDTSLSNVKFCHVELKRREREKWILLARESGMLSPVTGAVHWNGYSNVSDTVLCYYYCELALKWDIH